MSSERYDQLKLGAQLADQVTIEFLTTIASTLALPVPVICKHIIVELIEKTSAFSWVVRLTGIDQLGMVLQSHKSIFRSGDSISNFFLAHPRFAAGGRSSTCYVLESPGLTSITK